MPYSTFSTPHTDYYNMSLPKTYKQAVFKAAGQPLTIEDARLELPKKGKILVKVEACGVCYSDMFAQNNVMGGGL